MIGQTFIASNAKYQIVEIDELEELNYLKDELKKNNKEPRIYYAGKILRSGEVSKKQGGAFYRFNSGRFIKV